MRAGVRSIEHGNLLDDASARLIAQHGVFLVPTLVVYDQIAEFGRELGFPDESLRKLDDVLGAGLGSVEIALRAGVKVGLGTDLLGETHDAQSKELTIRARIQEPVDVIRSATVVNVELLGKPDELGVIAPGAYADLLLVNGDPLADIGVLGRMGERIDLVVRGGEVVKDPLAAS